MPQEREADHAPANSQEAFSPHPIQGWAGDFVPYVLQEAVDHKLYDELGSISGPEGMEWSRKLAQQEGIFCGISGGTTFGIAMRYAERAEPGTVILCMLPDTGERYLSSPMFGGIAEGMDEGEIALSNSTPGYQMGDGGA